MKAWLIQVGIKRFGPSAIRGAILALTGLIAAHQGVLATLGIVYDKLANTVTIHLDGLSAGLFILLTAAGAGLIKVTQHQAATVLPKKETTDSIPPAA